jgi:hypothetical protein
MLMDEGIPCPAERRPMASRVRMRGSALSGRAVRVRGRQAEVGEDISCVPCPAQAGR